MTEWRGRETAGSNERATLAGRSVTGDRTDLQKVGSVFFGDGAACRTEGCTTDKPRGLWLRSHRATKKQ